MVGAALFVGLGLGFWQQASGSEAAVYYSPHVLEVGEERRGEEEEDGGSRCCTANLDAEGRERGGYFFFRACDEHVCSWGVACYLLLYRRQVGRFSKCVRYEKSRLFLQ